MSEIRDPYTAGHQCRVGALSAAVAVDLGLSDHVVSGIRVAGELHDVGKIAVPSEILSRPVKLTVAEMELVKCHPRSGFDIVRGIDFPWPVAEMVLQHHERLDGSGYPLGLRGDQVLQGSRILAVADTVEAMSNHRPYRPALGLDLALAEITAGAGLHYDPDVVDACVALFEEGRFGFDTVPLTSPADSWVLPLAHEIPQAHRAHGVAS
jgi:HD-GYP domain-containing protein (c-di-GMP phosphodiesterase class II)